MCGCTDTTVDVDPQRTVRVRYFGGQLGRRTLYDREGNGYMFRKVEPTELDVPLSLALNNEGEMEILYAHL
jgi:hypothetical protein